MIGKIVMLVATVAAVSGTSARGLAGVDPNTLSCDPRGEVFLLLPHHTDCAKYYMCAHGQEVEFKCSGDLIFDFVLQTCNWRWATKCTLRTQEPDEIDGSGDDSIDEPVHSRASLLATPLVGDDMVALRSGVHRFSDQGVAQLKCATPQLSVRLAPYRGDCQRYWRCNAGAAEAAFCSDGLYFNPSSLQCDFEANVSCARDAIDEIGNEFIAY